MLNRETVDSFIRDLQYPTLGIILYLLLPLLSASTIACTRRYKCSISERTDYDTHLPESVVTEEIFVPIGKSSRNAAPLKGAMTAHEDKKTTQTLTGTLHAPKSSSIRFTEERHRSRTINIVND
ncbi:unnamed protein product [Thelazia callipaeda]|uniref:Uncharacterized protein n=1 Tax=Thelazia callipaeda TaxID=103827 RepID=A0A0N5DCA4_THECL|nr:unnamed protein product [Thelazia callipaeda]